MTIGDNDEFRDTADDILSRPEFQEDQPTIVQRAIDWIFERLGDAFGGVVGSGGGYIIGYLILAVAAGLAVYLLWRFLPRRRLARTDDAIDIGRSTTIRRSRDDWLLLAAEAEASGQWDRAVHARYHALTTGLADDEQLAPEPSVTSGEHRAEFAARAQVGDRVVGDEAAGDEADGAAGRASRVGVFNQATDRYEDVWFGGAVAHQPDNTDLQDVDRRLLDGDR